MKTKEEIQAEIIICQERLNKILPGCQCGCEEDTIHYYENRIKTLEWVIGINPSTDRILGDTKQIT